MLFSRLLIIGVSSLLTSNIGLASFGDHSFYLDSGLSIHRFHPSKKAHKLSFADTKKLKNDNVGFNFVLGKRFGSIGAELGYTNLSSQKYERRLHFNHIKVSESLKHESANFFLDVNNYFNLVDNLELKTAVGLGVLQAKTRRNVYDTVNKKLIPELRKSEAEVKPRVGAGLQYNVTREWSANIDIRYQYGNQDYSSMRSTALYLTYRL